MSSIRKDPKSNLYRIQFRFSGRQFQRSLKTKVLKEARAIVARVDETIRLIMLGRLSIPDHVDPAAFILSDGNLTESKLSCKDVLTLSELFSLYEECIPEGAKEESTRIGERRHMKWLKQHIGSRTMIRTIDIVSIQRYVESRRHDKWRGKTIGAETIKKELTTFRLIWNWAERNSYVKGRCPTRGVQLPKRDEKPQFMTRDEISLIIQRDNLDEETQKEYWNCLYLGIREVDELLKHVEQNSSLPFVYPMFVFAAHTGARRSEIVRSRIEDFDFDRGLLRIREKKRSRRNSISFRQVPITSSMQQVMTDWFANHVGGPFAIQQAASSENLSKELSVDTARYYFENVLSGSEWSKVKGFHTLRHSFASNAAAAGIDSGMIDSWMGHQTEEMRNRYRHLFPQQQKLAIDRVFENCTG